MHYKQYFAALPFDADIFHNVVTVSSFHTVIQLVKEGAGFSIVPECFVKDEIESGILKEIYWCDNLPRLRLYLTWSLGGIRLPRNQLLQKKFLSKKYPADSEKPLKP